MQKYQLRLGSFLLILTCFMLAFMARYERNRVDELESTSITVEDSGIRKLLELDLELMERETELLRAISQFREEAGTLFEGVDVDVAMRAKLANFRNAKLKLARERHKLAGMRTDILKSKQD